MKIELDNIYNIDCLEGLKLIPDNSVDLLITDPPYKFVGGGGGGAFGANKRDYHSEYLAIKDKRGYKDYETQGKRLDYLSAKRRENIKKLGSGFDFEILDECCRVMKKINAYVWCGKEQILDLMQYFKDRNCNVDLLTWHKTNPIPTCNNTYLSDTEYLVFAREKGVKVYGEYKTKKKYWVTKCNVADKKKWGHPTIKPLDIIETLITNSSQVGGVILDPFMGSGTTAIASRNLDRHFIGFEIDKDFYDKSQERLNQPTQIIADWRLP